MIQWMSGEERAMRVLNQDASEMRNEKWEMMREERAEKDKNLEWVMRVSLNIKEY